MNDSEIHDFVTRFAAAWAARDGAAFLALRRLGKSGRLCCFLPAAAEIGGAEDGRAQMSGLRRRKQRAAIARIEHQMIDDVAEEMWTIDPPILPGRIAMIEPGAFARGDHDRHPACRRLARLRALCGFG